MPPAAAESPHAIIAQHYMRILRDYPARTYLEIGAGTGYLAAMVREAWEARVFIIDLPEILPLGFLYLHTRVPAGDLRAAWRAGSRGLHFPDGRRGGPGRLGGPRGEHGVFRRDDPADRGSLFPSVAPSSPTRWAFLHGESGGKGDGWHSRALRRVSRGRRSDCRPQDGALRPARAHPAAQPHADAPYAPVEVRRTGFVALDQGARRTLQTLASHLCATWLEPHPDPDGWATSMRERGIELLVCGTSDSAPGREAEVHAQRAAAGPRNSDRRNRGFPRKFRRDNGSAPDGCFASRANSPPRSLVGRRPAIPVHIGPAIRYDELRKSLDKLRRGDGSAERAVLWIGQPETADSLATLRRLLPVLAERSVRVWLRAHPRDAGYDHGAYAGLDAEDVTSLSLEQCLARRPRLVDHAIFFRGDRSGLLGNPFAERALSRRRGTDVGREKGLFRPSMVRRRGGFPARGRTGNGKSA